MPLAVWPPSLAGRPATLARHRVGDDHGALSASVAARIVATYSAAGDLVIALHSHAEVAAAARWLERRTLAVLTDGDSTLVLRRVRRRLWLPARPGAIRVLGTRTDRVPALLRAVTGRAQLIVTRLPGPCRPPGSAGHWQRWVLGYAAALRPGGVLVAQVAYSDRHGAFADYATETITGARAAGLIYHQHLVALDAPVSEQPVTPGPRSLLRPPANGGGVGRHRRAHMDLYVFVKPGAADA